MCGCPSGPVVLSHQVCGASSVSLVARRHELVEGPRPWNRVVAIDVEVLLLHLLHRDGHVHGRVERAGDLVRARLGERVAVGGSGRQLRGRRARRSPSRRRRPRVAVWAKPSSFMKMTVVPAAIVRSALLNSVFSIVTSRPRHWRGLAEPPIRSAAGRSGRAR